MLDRDQASPGSRSSPSPRSPYILGGSAPHAGDERWAQVAWPSFSDGMGWSRGSPGAGYSHAEWACARYPGVVTPAGKLTAMNAPPYSITSSFELSGDLYFVSGRVVLELTDGTGQPSQDRDLGSGVVGVGASVHGASAYVGTTGGVLHKLTSGAWSQAASLNRKYLSTTWMMVQNVGSHRLWGTPSATTIAYTLDGVVDPLLAPSWSANIEVGDASEYAIRGLAASPQHIYVIKQDGIYDVTEGGQRTVNLTPWWKETLDDNNGVGSIFWNGYIIAPHAHGLQAVDVASAERINAPVWIQPGYGLPTDDSSPIRGSVTALASFEDWLIAAVHNNVQNKTYICYGRPRAPGDPLPGWLWHGAEAVISGGITHMRVSSPGGNPRLWIASEGPLGLAWQSLPRAATPLQDLDGSGDGVGQHRFHTSFTFTLPREDWGNSTAKKNLRRGDVISARLGGGTHLTASVAIDATGFEGHHTALVSPHDSWELDLNQGYQIQPRVDGLGTDVTPPCLWAFALRADVNVELADEHRYTVVIGEGVTLTNGEPDDRRPEDVWDALRELAEPEAGRVTLTDEFGVTREAIVGQRMPWVLRPHPSGGWIRVVEITVEVLNA